MFNIATASEKEIPAIIALAEKTWWPAYSTILSGDQIRYMLRVLYDPATLAAQIRSSEQTYLIITAGDQAKGFASFGPRSQEHGVFKLHKLYVLPENQKNGYGHALIREVIDRLIGAGIRTLDVNVNRFNPARAFYEKMGFQVIREEDNRIGPYWMNDYVMRSSF